jgi:hypothetical protein
MRNNKHLLTVAVSVTAAVTVFAAVAIAADAGHKSASGHSITAVKLVSQTDTFGGSSGGQTTSSNSFVTLPGATTTVSVPARQKALIVVIFTGSSACFGGAAANGCLIRVTIGGVQANPTGLTIFDSVQAGAGTDVNESHSVIKWRGPLGPGSYPVKVQWAANTGSSFNLRGWSMEVQRVRVS